MTKWYDMMNISSSISTSLTSMLISFNCLSFLRCPIRPTFFLCYTVQILWVILSCSVLISTYASTIFPTPFCMLSSVSVKFFSTADTNMQYLFTLPRLYRRILTGRRATLSSTMSNPRRNYSEYISTILTNSFNCFFHILSIRQTWDGIK